MLSNLTVICTRAKSGYLLQVLARPRQGKSIILGSLAQDVRCCCTTTHTQNSLRRTLDSAYSLIKNSSISTMDDNWEEQIKAFSAAKLRKTKTKITTPGGRKLVETRNDYGRVITDRAGDDGVGFIGDVKEDVQVGEILPGLLLGSQYLAHDYELLKKHKVTHLLGLGVIDTNIFSEIIYKGINILDMPSTDITSYFGEAFSFIDEARAKGCVLVHCSTGVSRAPAVVVGYLMKRAEYKTFREAFDHVKARRPATAPNAGFMRQLSEYEEKIRTKPVLYSYWRSSCSYRVRIALAIKGVDYDYKAVNLLEDMSDEYRSLNPMAQVPTLVIDGQTLTQSTAIIEYLNDTCLRPPLLPAKPEKRAQVRAITEMINSGIQPIQNLGVLKKVAEIGGDKVAWGRHWIERGFAALERTLAATAGRYCVGDAVTMADCCLVPQVYNAARFKVELSAYPTIERVYGELVKLPAVQAAAPDSMPDAAAP